MCFLLVSCASSVRFSSTKRGTAVANSGMGQGSASQGESVPVGTKIRGIASFYGSEFEGKMTANGEIFSQSDMTAAHRTLPFGTILKVKNLKNNKTVTVRVNDRGPFKDDRILDLSKAAAEQLGIIRDGTAQVEITVMSE